MQTYDFLMLMVLVGMTLFGFAKGMAWQVAYFSSFIVSYFVALNFSAQLAPVFGQSEQFNRLAAMLVIYAATSLGIWMLFRAVASAIDRVKLKEFDRQMGAIVGLARGVLWCIAITFVAATLLESQRSAILGSHAGHYIAVVLDKSQAIVPAEINEVIQPYVSRVRQTIDPTQPPPPNPFEGAPWNQQGGSANSWPTGGNSSPATTQPAGTSPPPATWPSAPGSATPSAPWPSAPGGVTPTPWLNHQRSASQGSGQGNY